MGFQNIFILHFKRFSKMGNMCSYDSNKPPKQDIEVTKVNKENEEVKEKPDINDETKTESNNDETRDESKTESYVRVDQSEVKHTKDFEVTEEVILPNENKMVEENQEKPAEEEEK